MAGAHVCVKCGTAIRGAFLEIDDGKFYHPACFVCSQCKEPIGGEFTKLDGEPVCIGCAPKHICKHCNKPIDGNFTSLNGAKYHPDCLRCTVCSEHLSGNVFFVSDNIVCGRCKDHPDAGKAIVKVDKVENDLEDEGPTREYTSSREFAKPGLQGHLYQRKPGVRAKLLRYWDWRYFVVGELQIRWWDNMEDYKTNEPCTGSIDFRCTSVDVRVSTWRSDKFYISPKGEGESSGRGFHFDVTSSEHSAVIWIESIIEEARLGAKEMGSVKGKIDGRKSVPAMGGTGGGAMRSMRSEPASAANRTTSEPKSVQTPRSALSKRERSKSRDPADGPAKTVTFEPPHRDLSAQAAVQPSVKVEAKAQAASENTSAPSYMNRSRSEPYKPAQPVVAAEPNSARSTTSAASAKAKPAARAEEIPSSSPRDIATRALSASPRRDIAPPMMARAQSLPPKAASNGAALCLAPLPNCVADQYLGKLEQSVMKLSAAQQNLVRKVKAENELLQHCGKLRDLVTNALQDTEDKDRSQLMSIYGGDCERIARLRGLLQAVPDQLSDSGKKDRRLQDLLKSVEIVESIIKEKGQTKQLKEAMERRGSWLPPMSRACTDAGTYARKTSTLDTDKEFCPPGLAPHSQKQVLQATHSFKSGGMGIVCDDNGFVQEVSPDGQAHAKGIRKGDQIVKVGAAPFSKAALVRAEKSGVPYEVTVLQAEDEYRLPGLANHALKQVQATHSLKPGTMGIVCDDNGIVQEVTPDGQAHARGIKLGDKIVKVGTDPFSKAALDRAERSGVPYEVTVLPSLPPPFVTHSLRPGKMGIVCDDHGVVQEVSPGGQAHSKGMKKGDHLVKVCNDPYSKDALARAENSGAPYEATILRPDDEYCPPAAHRFKPGKMGFVCDENGVVQEVDPDGQARANGVKKGDKILKVGADPFSKNALDRAEKSGVPHEVTVQPSLPLPLAAHSLTAGKMGVVCDGNGVVQEVSLGGQAHARGIQKGDRIMKVGTDPYSKDALDRAEKSGAPHEVTVLHADGEYCPPAAHRFKPGKMGVVCDENGFVQEVSPGGQAHAKGIEKGDKILKVDTDPFSKAALDRAEKSGVPYEVTVQPSMPLALAAHSLKPGKMGVVCDGNGVVQEVNPGGQANAKGIVKGDQIVKVGHDPYSNEALDRAEKSGVPYEVTVRPRTLAAHTLKPGKMGVACDGNGVVQEVSPGGQAHAKGIVKGDQIVKVGSDPYSSEALDRAEKSGVPYEVTVQPSLARTLAAHLLKPGKMGVACDGNGVVQEVSPGGQAHAKGIKKGDRIVKVGADPFSEKALDCAEKSGVPYEVTVVPADDEYCLAGLATHAQKQVHSSSPGAFELVDDGEGFDEDPDEDVTHAIQVEVAGRFKPEFDTGAGDTFVMELSSFMLEVATNITPPFPRTKPTPSKEHQIKAPPELQRLVFDPASNLTPGASFAISCTVRLDVMEIPGDAAVTASLICKSPLSSIVLKDHRGETTLHYEMEINGKLVASSGSTSHFLDVDCGCEIRCFLSGAGSSPFTKDGRPVPPPASLKERLTPR